VPILSQRSLLELLQESQDKHSNILGLLADLATPEKATSSSFEDALRNMRDLDILIGRISLSLSRIVNRQNRTYVENACKAADSYRKKLRTASRKARLRGVSNSWTAQEILLRAQRLLSEDLVKDTRLALALSNIGSTKSHLLMNMTVRTWNYDIEEDLGAKIRSIEGSEIVFKDSGIRYYDGGLFLYATIVSVAANVATIADILYRYLKKQGTSRGRPRKSRVLVKLADGSEVYLEDLPPAKVEAVLRAAIRTGSRRRRRPSARKPSPNLRIR
jgi:hypothetical protein